MKCHYITDKKTGNRVLIPECMGTAVHNDISFCCCPDNKKTVEQRLTELEERIIKLENKDKLTNTKE